MFTSVTDPRGRWHWKAWRYHIFCRLCSGALVFVSTTSQGSPSFLTVSAAPTASAMAGIAARNSSSEASPSASVSRSRFVSGSRAGKVSRVSTCRVSGLIWATKTLWPV